MRVRCGQVNQLLKGPAALLSRGHSLCFKVDVQSGSQEAGWTIRQEGKKAGRQTSREECGQADGKEQGRRTLVSSAEA